VSRVLVVTFNEFVRDPRALRHVAALQEQYEVVSCGQGPAPDRVVQHLQLPAADHLPRTPAGLANLAMRRTDRAYARVPLAAAARRALAGCAFDLAIACDLPAVPVTIQLANGRPVIADMYEYSPRQFEGDWRWRLAVQPYARALCRDYLPKAALVTSVCDGIAAEYRRQFGAHCVTITNAGPYRAPQPRPVGPVVRAVHSGAAQPNRELELMIRAAADLPGLLLDVYLVATPQNRRYFRSLQDQAAGTSNVRVLEPVPMAELPQTLDSYDLGVFVLPPNSFNAEHALPNKFFDFVQSGLGVVIGPSPEMAALTRRHGLGLVVPDFTGTALRSALAALRPADVAVWKAAACAAAEQLSSDSQARALRRHVADQLAAASR
jgi:hypothetical protein